MNEVEKCGYIAIVGRPNVGKSTLLNAILKQKVSITSPKPQTTRYQILGIKTEGPVQSIYIDTPGIHKTQKFAMNRYMNRIAASVIPDANVIVFVIEALLWQEEDQLVFEQIQKTQAPVILVINKVDTVKDKSKLLPFIEKSQSRYDFAAIIPISAMQQDQVTVLEKKIAEYLPNGVHLFPDDEVTDKNIQFQTGELIREKIMLMTQQEVPYSTTVSIESLVVEKKLVRISAIIWVEREGQKPILIGEKGKKLKSIGTRARKDIEKLLGQKVFLQLWVKVKENWTDDERALKTFGYD